MQHSVTVPGEAEQAPAVRHAVRTFLRDNPAIDDAELIVAELFTNALLHSRSGHGGHVTVLVSVTEEHVRLSCVDQGGPDRPRVVVARDTDEHHRGLALVSLLATAFGHICEPGRTEV